MSREGQLVQRQLEKISRKYHPEVVLKRNEVGWCDASGTVEEIQAKLQSKQEAILRRERALAYADSRSLWKKEKPTQQRSMAYIDCEPDKGGWGWSWLERWMVARPWENRLMMAHYQAVNPKAKRQGALRLFEAQLVESKPHRTVELVDMGKCKSCGRRVLVKPSVAQAANAAAAAQASANGTAPSKAIPHTCNICAPTVSWAAKVGALPPATTTTGSNRGAAAAMSRLSLGASHEPQPLADAVIGSRSLSRSANRSASNSGPHAPLSPSASFKLIGTMASSRKPLSLLIAVVALLSMPFVSRAISKVDMLQELVVYSEDDAFTFAELEAQQAANDEEIKAAAIANAFHHLHGSEDFSGAEDDDYVSVSSTRESESKTMTVTAAPTILDAVSQTLSKRLRGFFG
ncbi:unnamed protein product [Closterium sp. NIES-65]|nr:unnamed protein product [Closterium sp. NIES-65]